MAQTALPESSLSDERAIAFAKSLHSLNDYDGNLTDLDARLLEAFGPAEMCRVIKGLHEHKVELLAALAGLLEKHIAHHNSIHHAAARKLIADMNGGAA